MAFIDTLANAIYEQERLRLPVFSEDWRLGVDASEWTRAGDVLPVRDTTEAAYLKLLFDPGATQTSQLNGVKQYQVGLFGVNNLARELNIIFEARLTNVADVDNTAFFMGLSALSNGTRASNNIIGYALSGDALIAVLDVGGVEVTRQFTALNPTLTNWNIYRIRVVGREWPGFGIPTVEMVVNQRMTQVVIANIPQQNMYLRFHLLAEGAGTAELHLGRVIISESAVPQVF